MKILSIETSCDETAAAVIEDGVNILSNVVVSQIDIFAAYGGVIPEIAARSHLEAILPVINQSLEQANLTWDDIDAIAVTHTPGLLGSLLIGTLTARTLALLHNKPLYPIHHLKSHIYSNWLPDITQPGKGSLGLGNVLSRSAFSYEKRGATSPVTTGARSVPRKNISRPKPPFPLIALVISGGHTQLIKMTNHNDFEIIGTTRDDAVGECFDKVAKILGLPYPGGPAVSKAAQGEFNGKKVQKGNPEKYQLPHPKVDGFDFSFSGLKTAVLRSVQKTCNLPLNHPSNDLKNHLTDQQIADYAASFEKTAIDILLEKLALALKQHPETKSIVFAGGVAANQRLREEAKRRFLNNNQYWGEETRNLFSEEYKRSAARENTPEGVFSRRVTLEEKSVSCFFPPIPLSGDNAAMVGAAAYFEIKSGVPPVDPYTLNIVPRSPITALH